MGSTMAGRISIVSKMFERDIAPLEGNTLCKFFKLF